MQAGCLLLFWCDCLPTASQDSLARRIAEPVVRAAARKGPTQWAKAAATLFKRIRPSLSLGPDGEVGVSIDLAESGATSADIEDALLAAGRLANARSKPAVFGFDEFQQIGC